MNTIKNKPDLQLIKQWLGTGSINIFGLPFAGKDTHGRELAEIFGGELIGGGDIIRSSEKFNHIQEHVNTGALAPTEEYLRIILPHLQQREFEGKPLILSSVGRWHGEEAGVIAATSESGHPLKAVLLLSISEQEMYERWKTSKNNGGRDERNDDKEHVLEKRLSEYRSKTLPVINFYRDQGMLIELDGIQDKNTVSTEIMEQFRIRAISHLSE